MYDRTHLCALAAVLLVAGGALGGDAWPEHRGPTADGQSDATGLPATWSESRNVVWKTAIHDRGWSSPVVWGDQVWVTTATADGKRLFAVCVDRESGKVLRDIKVFDVARPERIAPVNSYASPTPAIEEGRIYVHYGTYGTASLDTKTGTVLWSRRDLNCDHHMGPGSSPILCRDRLAFQVDGTDVQYVVALDKSTGKTVWRADRSVDFRGVHPMRRKSFCTPAVIRASGRLQLVSPGSQAVMAYDIATGEELWRVRYFGWSMVARPVFAEGFVYVVVDYDHPELWAIRTDGKGDVTDTHVAWKRRRGIPSTPSLLLIGGGLYMVTDKGVVACVDAKSGDVVWQERLGGNYSSSPVFADGRMYFLSQEGVTTVLKPGNKLEKLAVNELEGEFRASPAIAGKSLFLRSRTHLYRIEERPGSR